MLLVCCCFVVSLFGVFVRLCSFFGVFTFRVCCVYSVMLLICVFDCFFSCRRLCACVFVVRFIGLGLCVVLLVVCCCLLLFLLFVLLFVCLLLSFCCC